MAIWNLEHNVQRSQGNTAIKIQMQLSQIVLVVLQTAVH